MSGSRSSANHDHNLRGPAERKPKQLEDYESPSFSPSASSDGTDFSDIERGSERESDILQKMATMRDVLNKLYSPDPAKPTRTCDWSLPCNAKILKKDFKIRRRYVSPDIFLCHYIYNGDDAYYNLRLQLDELQNLRAFASHSTQCLDTTEVKLFFSQLPLLPTGLSADIKRAVAQYIHSDTLKQYLKNVEDSGYRLIAQKLLPGICDWLTYLAKVITKSPEELNESIFEELIRTFMTTFGLYCVSGKTENLKIPLEKKDVACYPDLLFLSANTSAHNSNSSYLGAVEVKRMTSDPTFKHVCQEPSKGMMKDTEQSPQVDVSDTPFHSGEEHSEDDQDVTPAKRIRIAAVEDDGDVEPDVNLSLQSETNACTSRSDIIGSILPDHVRNTIDTFFFQLFGQILALDIQQDSPKSRRIGIGVVGFRVMFLAFYCKPNVKIGEIPGTKGGKIEVHVTRPLCILDAKDRDEIVKMLFLLAVEEPVYSYMLEKSSSL